MVMAVNRLLARETQIGNLKRAEDTLCNDSMDR